MQTCLSGHYKTQKTGLVVSVEDYQLLYLTFKKLMSSAGHNDDVFIYGDANMSDIQWVTSELQDDIYDPINIHNNYYEFLTNSLSFGFKSSL